MPFADQMLAGVNLMLLGMGIVFAFLIILVFALKAMSELARMIGDTETELTMEPATRAAPGASDITDGELVAVITAAVNRFRGNRNR